MSPKRNLFGYNRCQTFFRSGSSRLLKNRSPGDGGEYRGRLGICGARRIWSHLLTLWPSGMPPERCTAAPLRAGSPQPYSWRDYALRFIRSLTNVFPQGIVVSEQLHRDPWSEHVAVPASRTTMQPCRADSPASLCHLATEVLALASSWGFSSAC
jgi:hypothetical protein